MRFVRNVDWNQSQRLEKKSKASLGSIAAVDRDRVADLQNPDSDRPLAAHWRVSWQKVF